MTPRTAAGQRLLAKLDYTSEHSQDTSFPAALDDILDIEAEATADLDRLRAVETAARQVAYDWTGDETWTPEREAQYLRVNLAALRAALGDRAAEEGR